MCRWRVPFVARVLGGSQRVQMCELERVGGVDVGVQGRKGEREADEESGVRGVREDGSGVRKEAPGV